MKSSESIWEKMWGRVGFAIMCGLAGVIYGLAASLIIFLVFKKLSIFHIVKVFSCVFGAAGFILGSSTQRIIESMFYPLYFIWGAVIAESMTLFPTAISEPQDILPKRKFPLILVTIGFISVMLCFLLW